MLRLTDISITRSLAMIGSWCMEITVMTPLGEMKSTQHFDDMGGFLTAVYEAATFFAVRLGRVKSNEANGKLGLTRALAPNREGSIQ